MATPRNRAHDFFDTHVVPAMNGWHGRPEDIQLAMSAAVVLNQMVDQFWLGFANTDPARVLNAQDIKTFRRELAQKYNDWSLVRDVAEAHKHGKLNRNDRSVTSAGQIVVIPTSFGTLISDSGAYVGPRRWS